jgi:flavin-dependent dehydrogenase
MLGAMGDERHPIRIAGAGPAGLAAAIVLARAGRTVRVVEQRDTVAARFNDDFQGIENWTTAGDAFDELREAGLEPSWWSRASFEGVLYDPKLRPTMIRSPRAIFYAVRRGAREGSLDRALLAQAHDAGVEIVFGRRLPPAEADIVASGPLGRPVAIARGITFATRRADLTCAVLNDDLSPAGYAYLLVADGQATLATVLFERFGEVHRCLERSRTAVERLCDITIPSDAAVWGGQGMFRVPDTCRRDGALWVGEAAGFQDLLFGFGIRYALVSGILAARSLLEGHDYDEAWRSRLLPYLKASVVNRAAYAGLGDLARTLFWRAVGRTQEPCRVLRRIYSLSPLHRVVYPFCR